MTSKMLIWSPSEKLSSDKCNSSTSFTDVTLSKVTLRTQKSKRESKKSCLAVVCEEADSQNDYFSFPNEENSLLNKTNLKSGNVVKKKKHMKATEKRCTENTGLEAHVKDSSNKDEQHINENTDSSSRKKHKKHKKHKNRLAIGCEVAGNQNYSFSFTNEENILLNKTNINAVNVAKNKKNMKADKIVFKRCIENTCLEAEVNDYYYSSSKYEQQINTEQQNSRSSHNKLKKHKKHKNLDSFIEPENDTVMSSMNSTENPKQSIKHKNKTGGVIFNKSDVEKTSYKMDSPVNTPNDGKPVKRKLSLSQSNLDHNTSHAISDDSDTTHCSTKSLVKSNLFNSHKKCKRKFRPNSNEPKTSYFCRENNVDNCMFGENETLTHFQDQESAEFSESILGSKLENRVSLEMSSSWVSPKNKKSHIYKRNPSSPDSNQSPGTKYKGNETQISQAVLSDTSFVSNKKPKKRKLSCSNLEVNQLSTTLNENYHFDVNKPNTSEKALVESCEKYKLSMSSADVFDKTSTIIGNLSNNLDEYDLAQKLPTTKAKQKTQEMRNEFCSNKTTTEKEKAKINKSKNFKATNISNSAILDVGQNQKYLITEALNKVSSKSDKNNESIHAEGGGINIKPNYTPPVLKINQTTKKKVKRPKAKDNILLNKSTCASFDIDKVQQDLLAAALESITSKKSSISKRNPSSPDSNQSPDTKYQENETQISQGVLSNTSFMSNKKPKKRKLSSSNLEVNKLSTTLNENYHCDVNEHNTSEETLVEPCQKYKLSMGSAEVFDKTSTTILSSKSVKTNTLNESIHADSTIIGQCGNDSDKYELSQNLPKSKAKQKTLEMKKSKRFKAINISNSAILDVGQNQKDLIAEGLNKVCSKSVKNNESIHAECGRINIEPNDMHSVVNTNPTTKQKVKHPKANILLNESSCDKVQQDLLAAALKSINKSPKSRKINRSDKNEKERKYKKPIKEGKKRIPKIIHEKAKESNSTLKLEIVQNSNSNIPYQTLSQPCTSQDVGSIGKVKSGKNPKMEKVKSKLIQDGTLDIEKFQRQLLAAALKKIKSEPIEIQTSVNPELHLGSKTKPKKEELQAKSTIEERQAMPTKEEKQTKPYKEEKPAMPAKEEKQAKGNEIITKRVKEVKEKNKTGLKKKLKENSVRDPFEDFTAKLLSAELEKRKRGLMNT